MLQNLPNFGTYRKEKAEVIAKLKEGDDLLADKYQPEPKRPANQPSKGVPTVQVRVYHTIVMHISMI